MNNQKLFVILGATIVEHEMEASVLGVFTDEKIAQEVLSTIQETENRYQKAALKIVPCNADTYYQIP